MPAWPSTLPQYPNNGEYEETPPHILIQDEVSEGPANARRKLGARKLSLPYRFTAAQTDIFDAWLDSDVAGGSLPYDWTWPPPPRTTLSVSARITAIPKYKHVGGGAHDVTLEVIILP
ncbi:MAG: hypothetical protein WC600_17210 [Desulfobaccales bacterium]